MDVMSRRWKLNASQALTHIPWHHTNPGQYDGDIDLSSDDLPAGLVPTNLCGKSANAYTLQTLKAKANYVLPSDVGTAVFIELSRKFERPYSYPASAPTAAQKCRACGKTEADHTQQKFCYVRNFPWHALSFV